MTGKFNYGKFNHPIYFIPDAAHMLKLARNALADLDYFVDGDGRKSGDSSQNCMTFK